jgi:hypothetical protein
MERMEGFMAGMVAEAPEGGKPAPGGITRC